MGLAQGVAAGLGGVLLALSAGAARPQGEDIGAGAPVFARGAPISQQDVNTEAGRPVTLFHYVRIDGGCERAPVAIRLVEAPGHGAFALEDGEERPWSGGHPLFDAADPRAHCGDRLTATKDGVYTPAPGFTGHDTLTVEFTEAGGAFTDTITVSVW
jgi:hypothetical protein